MASDNRSSVRNVAHQVRVAVIGNVKDVKVAALSPQITRVVEESIQQSVSVEPRMAETLVFTGRGRPREAPLERGPYQHWFNLVSRFRTETIE
jgi:hypothetical protein